MDALPLKHLRIEMMNWESPMKGIKGITICLILSVLWASILIATTPAALRAQTRFVTIGSGDTTGVYYPTGLIIAKMINEKRDEYGVRAAVESTRGSVFNVNAITAGYLEFGLVQSDKQFEAVNGLAEWTKKGPQKELRAVFSIHHESVNLVGAADARIKTIGDLKGKRVNLGNPGSGQYKNAIDALEAVGLDPNTDILLEKARAAEAPRLLPYRRFFLYAGTPK